MASVILITDHSKTREIFSQVESDELSLRFAPTLSQGEEEIAAAAPNYVFVQNRISGLSGDIIARYLKGLLPASAQTVVLTHDAADSEEIRQTLGYALDMSQPPAVIKEAVLNLVAGKEPLQKPSPAAPQAVPRETARDLLFTIQDQDIPSYQETASRPAWLIPLVLALLCLPLASYQAGKSWGKRTVAKENAIGAEKVSYGGARR